MAVSKSVLLTGGYGGIGFEASRAIAQARAGWHIVIAGRDRALAEAAATRLIGEFGPDVASARQLDLAALSDVSRFSTAFAADLRGSKLPPLFGLMCNAGTQTLARQPTFTVDVTCCRFSGPR